MTMHHPDLQPIWHAVNQVPYGKVASYGQIAKLADMPGQAQFVGRSLSDGSKPANLPWHRIIRGDGQIAFPDDSPVAREQVKRLLAEGITVINNAVPMQVFQWHQDDSGTQARLDF